MKIRVTKKSVRSDYKNIICIGYCNIQSLLVFQEPYGYTTRSEGWGSDVYHININTAIVTGYDPFGNIKPSYETQRKYEEKARTILQDYTFTQDEVREKINNLLDEFIMEVTQC